VIFGLSQVSQLSRVGDSGKATACTGGSLTLHILVDMPSCRQLEATEAVAWRDEAMAAA
jgi:hypothetical protein